MTKARAYFWRGQGELKIAGEGLFKTGQKIPHKKMEVASFDALLASGDIKGSEFDIVESSTAVADLEKQVKTLSEQIVGLNSSDDKLKVKELTEQAVVDADRIAELTEQAAVDAGRIAELEQLLESATDDGASGDGK